jgi:hypothetical protein
MLILQVKSQSFVFLRSQFLIHVENLVIYFLCIWEIIRYLICVFLIF